MSNEIYGFAEFAVPTDFEAIVRVLSESSPLGVFADPDLQLHGFPPELQPDADALKFVVGDSPKSDNAEYLLDNRDYDPEATIGLPFKAEERIALLIRLLSSFFTLHQCTRLAISLTVCNEVDDVRHLQNSQMTDVLREDCRKECPPCKIYVITP